MVGLTLGHLETTDMMTSTEVLAQWNPTETRRSPVPSAFAFLKNARVALASVALTLAACGGDSPTAPQAPSIDRVAAARVMPSVTDARARLAPVIENVAIRDRVAHDLRELETALANGDGEKARFHVRVLSTVVKDYRSQLGSTTTDGADVTAMMLMLHVVSDVVNAGFEFPISQ